MRTARAFAVSLVIALLMIVLVHNDVGANFYTPPALTRIMWWVLIPSWTGGFITYFWKPRRK